MNKTFNEQQVNLGLSYIVSAGGDLVKPKPEEVQNLIRKSLDDSPVTQNQFDIVWGPAISRFPFLKYDNNVMMVVKNRQDASDYRVVIRATNASSGFDWIVEDAWVNKTVAWSEFDTKAPSGAKISAGTALGLSALLSLYPVAGFPGEFTNLIDFLENEIKQQTVKLTLVGHSLAGALSATLGLFINSYLSSTTFDLKIQASAGPTAGNSAFAGYSDQQLGNRLLRLHNSLDVVPHAWSTLSLIKIPRLYEPQINPSAEIILAVAAAVAISAEHGYTQPEPAQELSGQLNHDIPDFIQQMAWQHTTAYAYLLGLSDDDIVVAQNEQFNLCKK